MPGMDFERFSKRERQHYYMNSMRPVLDKKAMLMLQAYAKGAGDFQLLEVMSCKGGCIGGPCTIATQAKVINPIKNLVAESPKVKPAFGEEKKEERKKKKQRRSKTKSCVKKMLV